MYLSQASNPTLISVFLSSLFKILIFYHVGSIWRCFSLLLLVNIYSRCLLRPLPSSLVMSMRNPPQRRRSLGPVSPKRIYRNLSVRLRGGESAVSEEVDVPKRPSKPAETVGCFDVIFRWSSGLAFTSYFKPSCTSLLLRNYFYFWLHLFHADAPPTDSWCHLTTVLNILGEK